MSEDQPGYRAIPKETAVGTKDDYIKCFNTLHGRRVLEHLFQTYCINSFDPDPYTMAAKAGQHGLVMLICAMAGLIETDNSEKLFNLIKLKEKSCQEESAPEA